MRVFPGHTEFQVLRYAASALRDLDDERAASPCERECRSRRIALLDRIPTEFGTDVTLHHQGQVIKVGNLGGAGAGGAGSLPPLAREPAARPIDSLMVGINGQIAGLVDFRSSTRPRAATALQELRDRATPAAGDRAGLEPARLGDPPPRRRARRRLRTTAASPPAT